MTDYSDSYLKSVLQRSKTIAMIGASPNPVRPSHFVGRYLSQRGYRVIAVNPGHAGKELFGAPIAADLASIGEPVDMIDIFRRPEAVPAIVNEAIACLPDLRTVWMQLGIESEEGAATARAKGLDVIMNRCPKIEHQRLFGELRKAGFNTGIISSKL